MEDQLQEIISQAKLIFKDEYHSSLPLWSKNITKIELKGLRLTHQILKNQGLKKFRPSKSIQPSVSSRSLYKTISQYTEAYSENIIQKVFESEVLKFVSLSSMPIAKILRPEVLMFLERWIQLNDEETYQNFVLAFIKGYFSVIKVNDTAIVSTARDSYSRKKIERVPVYGRKKWVNEEVRVKLPELRQVKSVEVETKKTHLNDIKAYVCRDNKDMMKWVTGNNPFRTVYQDQFHSKSIQTLPYVKKNFYTSTSIKLLPDVSQIVN